VDVAIDATGVASAIDGTGRLVRMKPWDPPFPPSARLVILGSPQDPVVFSYHPTLFENEPDIFTSRDCVPDDIAFVLKLIASRKLSPLDIPHKVMDVADCQSAYTDLVNRKLMRVMFRWR
jgi:threonine dehydrogenase-like Zn-dependent dehydrogenase